MWRNQPALGRPWRVALRRLLHAAGFVLLFSPSVLAQGDIGVIYGSVTDARGQAQRVRVQLLAAGDILAGDVYTGAEGEYTFQALPSGEYWVVVEAEGFDAVRQPVMLDTHINAKMQVNLGLEASAASARQPNPVISGSASSHTVDIKRPTARLNPQALREYDKGKTQELQGDLEGAIDHYRKALRADPGYYPALNNLGALYERRGRHTQAEEVLVKAIARNPDDGEAYVNLGHSFYEEGRYRDASTQLLEGLKRSPNSATGRFLLGSAQLKLGDVDEAKSNLKQACALDPQGLPAAHLQLANAYLKARDLQQAATELETYLQANPSDPQAPAIRRLLASVKPPNP
ncbi:MAG TPA: tetratricopeptide repeat protein [Terriglobia bacterium]|nr:tetratricopeptide repeat protein [Terriglobia bacterium]